MIYEDRTVGLELWAVELLNCTEVTTLAKVWSATVYYLPASLYYLPNRCDPLCLHTMHSTVPIGMHYICSAEVF